MSGLDRQWLDSTITTEAWFAMPREQREDFQDWLAAQGLGVAGLLSVQLVDEGEPLLRLTRLVRDEEGQLLVTKDLAPLTETADVPPTIELPSWWRPVLD